MEEGSTLFAGSSMLPPCQGPEHAPGRESVRCWKCLRFFQHYPRSGRTHPAPCLCRLGSSNGITTIVWLVVRLEVLLHGSFSSRDGCCVIGQRVGRGVRVGHENGPSGDHTRSMLIVNAPGAGKERGEKKEGVAARRSGSISEITCNNRSPRG